MLVFNLIFKFFPTYSTLCFSLYVKLFKLRLNHHRTSRERKIDILHPCVIELRYPKTKGNSCQSWSRQWGVQVLVWNWYQRSYIIGRCDGRNEPWSKRRACVLPGISNGELQLTTRPAFWILWVRLHSLWLSWANRALCSSSCNEESNFWVVENWVFYLFSLSLGLHLLGRKGEVYIRKSNSSELNDQFGIATSYNSQQMWPSWWLQENRQNVICNHYQIWWIPTGKPEKESKKEEKE